MAMRAKRKLMIVAGITVLSSIFGFLVLKSENTIPFKTVSKGERLGYLNKDTMQSVYTILTNENELDYFLNKFGSHAKEIINFSEDDFKEYILICAYFGYAPSTGYEIEIKKIIKRDKVAEIIIQFITSKYGETQLTNPYHIVKVRRNYFENVGKFIFKDTNGRELYRVEIEI